MTASILLEICLSADYMLTDIQQNHIITSVWLHRRLER